MPFDANWRLRERWQNADADLRLMRSHCVRALIVAKELDNVWLSADSGFLLTSIRKLIAELDLSCEKLRVRSSEVPPCASLPGTAAE
jgi:hypothetical protein